MKIVVEVATPEVVKSLEKENSALREDLRKLQQQYNSLHETLYMFMGQFTELKRSIKDKK